MSFLTQQRLKRILENRERFVSADLDLGSALQELLEGNASVEKCLLALVEMQGTFDQYVSGIIGSLAAPRSACIDMSSGEHDLDADFQLRDALQRLLDEPGSSDK